MRQQIRFINCREDEPLRCVVDARLQRLERQLAAGKMARTAFLHGIVEKNPAHERYRVTLTLNVPARTLVAKEEGHEAGAVIREAMDELERQVAKHKAFIRQEPLWRRPARRAALVRERLRAAAAHSPAQEWMGELILTHLETLHNFARRELAAALAAGDLMPGELSVEDVVDTVVERALSRAEHRPTNLEVDRWLLKLSLEHVDAEVARLSKERASTVHLEHDIPDTSPPDADAVPEDEIFDFYQPDEALRLEDVVPARFIPTPEQINESRDLQHYVNRTLTVLPQAWRRAFVLHHVQGLSVSEVAAVLGMSEDQIVRSLEHARAFLREKIEESWVAAGGRGGIVRAQQE